MISSVDNCHPLQALEAGIQIPTLDDANLDDNVGEEDPILLTSKGSPESEVLTSSCSNLNKHHSNEGPMYRPQQLKINQ